MGSMVVVAVVMMMMMMMLIALSDYYRHGILLSFKTNVYTHVRILISPQQHTINSNEQQTYFSG